MQIYISFSWLTEYKSLHDSHNTCDLYTYEVCQRVSGVCDKLVEVFQVCHMYWYPWNLIIFWLIARHLRTCWIDNSSCLPMVEDTVLLYSFALSSFWFPTLNLRRGWRQVLYVRYIFTILYTFNKKHFI